MSDHAQERADRSETGGDLGDVAWTGYMQNVDGVVLGLEVVARQTSGLWWCWVVLGGAGSWMVVGEIPSAAPHHILRLRRPRVCDIRD